MEISLYTQEYGMHIILLQPSTYVTAHTCTHARMHAHTHTQNIENFQYVPYNTNLWLKKVW